MKNRINVAELLKDCPKGMELDCTEFDGVVKFDGFNKNNPYTIRISVMYDGVVTIHNLTKYGQTSVCSYNKCVIFPKGKTTWEGFQRPFKDGDILYVRTSNQWVCIYKEGGEKENVCHRYVAAASLIFVHDDSALCHRNNIKEIRFATQEEKERLFKAIKENGYRWNAETKTLEKLVTIFKVGDKIKLKNAYAKKYDDFNTREITEIKDSHYILDDEQAMPLSNQYLYELVPNKFNIATLKPLESKVLMRSSNAREWVGTIYSHRSNNKFYGCGMYCDQCIPYEGNEHLLGTTDDCDEYYKTWN